MYALYLFRRGLLGYEWRGCASAHPAVASFSLSFHHTGGTRSSKKHHVGSRLWPVPLRPIIVRLIAPFKLLTLCLPTRLTALSHSVVGTVCAEETETAHQFLEFAQLYQHSPSVRSNGSFISVACPARLSTYDGLKLVHPPR